MNLPILSMETAAEIWNAHREIQAAEKLRDEIAAALANGDDPTPLDAFGRRRNLSLGVPMEAAGSSRLFDVDPALAVHVINAHIVNKQKALANASIRARLELTSPDGKPLNA